MAFINALSPRVVYFILERGDNRLRTERQQLQVTEPSSATNMSNISLFPTGIAVLLFALHNLVFYTR
jgi:hypothetical protein